MIDRFMQWYRDVMPWYDTKEETKRTANSDEVVREARFAVSEANTLLASYRAADMVTSQTRHRELVIKKRF